MEKVRIENYECNLIDSWSSGTDTFKLGQCIEDSDFYYALVNGSYSFEYCDRPTRSEVEDSYIDLMAKMDIDRQEAEVFERLDKQIHMYVF